MISLFQLYFILGCSNEGIHVPHKLLGHVSIWLQRKVPQQVHYQHFCLYYVHIFAQTLSGPAPECLEGDRVDGSLVVAAEPLRVKLVGLRPVGGVQVEADLGSEDV